MQESIDNDYPDDMDQYMTEQEVQYHEWWFNKHMRLSAGPGYDHTNPFHTNIQIISDDLPW
jgi:hypothetical protein